MPSGRPRTTTPDDKELAILGEELVQWATEPTKDFRYHLNQWYCLKKGFTKKEWDLMCQKEIFRAYYEKARVGIAQRYVDGTINSSIAQRFIRHYFPEVKQDEDEQVVHKAQAARQKEEDDREDLVADIRKALQDKE